MNTKIYEKTRWENIFRHKVNKNYIITNSIRPSINDALSIHFFSHESKPRPSMSIL